jgi:hypothetical protein
VLDFVPAPKCSVMRHAVLNAAQQPRHCSSAHYEQLLYENIIFLFLSHCVIATARPLLL